MTEALTRMPTLIERWSALAAAARRSLRKPGEESETSLLLADLLPVIDAAAGVADRFAERVQNTEDSQPLANAASICRWELLTLRERLLELRLDPTAKLLQADVARHLESAAHAARVLSNGYRFHSIDRICDGGQALDEHLEALQQMRA